jgi:hypothetical protein
MDIHFSEFIGPKENNIFSLLDLIRICDFGAIPKFNMTPRAICGIRLAGLQSFTVQKLLSGLKFNMV